MININESIESTGNPKIHMHPKFIIASFFMYLFLFGISIFTYLHNPQLIQPIIKYLIKFSKFFELSPTSIILMYFILWSLIILIPTMLWYLCIDVILEPIFLKLVLKQNISKIFIQRLIRRIVNVISVFAGIIFTNYLFSLEQFKEVLLPIPVLGLFHMVFISGIFLNLSNKLFSKLCFKKEDDSFVKND